MGSTLCQPLCASSEIVHHLCDFTRIDRRVIPLYTIRRFSAAALIEEFYQILVKFAKLSKTLCLIVETFIVLDVQGDIPGFVVGVTVVGGGSHWFVWTESNIRVWSGGVNTQWTLTKLAYRCCNPGHLPLQIHHPVGPGDPSSSGLLVADHRNT